jgi:hypothetical protein
MKHPRDLIESRPVLVRVPDPKLMVGDPGQGTDYISATRARDGSYAFVYSPSGWPFTIDLERLSGAEVRHCWLDPETGIIRQGETSPRRGRREFAPPLHSDAWPGC